MVGRPSVGSTSIKNRKSIPMMNLHVRRNVAYFLAALQIVMSSLSLFISPAYAQILDTEPPTVGFDTVDESRKGDAQVFTVVATDNQSIESIVIFYRTDPEAAFQAADMMRIGETDLYTMTIAADAIPESAELIQYYIEAKDQAGNRTLQGFSFDPAERALISSEAALADNTPEQAQEESESLLGSLSTTQKVVYTVLGVIVVGALIAAAGSDGGSSSPTTQVTLTVPALETAQ